MKINAAVLNVMGKPKPYAESRPLEIQTLDLGSPGMGEVLIQIKAAGLCHSDLSVIDGSRPRPTPMALGHEAAGIIIEVGAGIDDLEAGDHVVLVFVPSCGKCIPCAGGRPALCEPGGKANVDGSLMNGKRHLSFNGEQVHHHLGVSAFADHAVVNRNSVVKIDKDLSFEEAALFGCAVITGVGSVLNTARVRAGESVAVIGLGGVGLNALLGALVSGAGEIVAVDIRDDKLELAKNLGATLTINASNTEELEEFISRTGGVDYAFEMAGSAPALESAWNMTRRGGHTITTGLPHPDKRISLSPSRLVVEERTLSGSYLGSCVPVRDIPAYIDLYRKGSLPVDKLMSDLIQLDEINHAFDRLASGETVRQIVVM
jgi:Zn-dependent alcohol dehydrogenase